jgi:hypothetical protein
MSGLNVISDLFIRAKVFDDCLTILDLLQISSGLL